MRKSLHRCWGGADFDTQWQAGLRGEPYDIEHRILVNHQTKWVREKAYLEFDTSGQLLGGFGVTQDITARKQAEEDLRESEALLRAVTDNNQDSIFMKDRKSRLLFANPATLRLIGKSAEVVIGKT